jgi:cytochrome P450
MKNQLPAGPRMPAVLQTLGTWNRPTAFLSRCRARYGKRFTIRSLGQPPFVVLSDPQDIKELFTAPPEVLHPGEGARILEPIVGRHSVILLDEAPHLEQRKLLLPAFHGERMQALAGLMGELTEREVSRWPCEETIELHPRLQRLTLEIVLEAVFGLEQGARLERLRELLTELLAFGDNPLSILPLPRHPLAQRVLSSRGPVAKLERLVAQADELIFALIEERRRDGAEGADVLALLLAAEHEDGSPMSPAELRDELMTALVAGHETTASQLAWAFAQLSREPAVVERLLGELKEGSDEEYLTATINEIMRLRPVLTANAHLVHRDPEIYPEPHAFSPERFLETPPGTYTWIPFGGGRRRCLGVSFALLEMKVVLREVLERYELEPIGERPETARRRGITISPAKGCQVILRDRLGARGSSPEVPVGALTPT